MPSKVPIVAWLGPNMPGAGKPKVTAVMPKRPRAVGSAEWRPPRPTPPTRRRGQAIDSGRSSRPARERPARDEPRRRRRHPAQWRARRAGADPSAAARRALPPPPPAAPPPAPRPPPPAAPARVGGGPSERSRLDPLTADRLRVSGGGEDAFPVAGVGREAKGHGCHIGFRPFVHEVREPGRAVDQDRQDTLGRRVQGSTVAGLQDTRKPAQRADNGEGRWSRRLVDVQDAGGHPRSFMRARTSASTLASASLSGSASSMPAARRWPPPPNLAASSAASTWSRLRMLTLVRRGPASLKRTASSWPRMVLS